LFNNVAVVMGNYIPPNAKAKGAAKANIRYIEHRPGKDGVRLWRTLFGSDGRIGREEAYAIIDQAEPGAVFWRLKISPDPKTEDSQRDLSMQEVTERTMNSLQEQLGREIHWVGAIHADHAPHRHIHVLALLPKLSKQEFARLPNSLRDSATTTCVVQRRELDVLRDYREHERMREDAQWERSLERGGVWA
jgi:hypothetical protein